MISANRQYNLNIDIPMLSVGDEDDSDDGMKVSHGYEETK